MAEYATREEHLAWCKKRALEYLDHGDIQGAFSSFASDMGKHPETKIPAELATIGMGMATASQRDMLGSWIKGFQ